MDSPSPGLAPVPGYNLHPPAEGDARAALQRVFGPERGEQRWAEACAAAGLPVGRVEPAQLERAVQTLGAQGGACTAIARSIEIRMRTYARLAGKPALTAGVRE
ncbi:MAG TPA: hypothetical protein VF665_24630 [Longimicrobium sp.]|jgi:hypothetical protein|uniref:hypothetical protein n=1 Tax=Longimicrobium sp. TaxID=2029185 RepID=UPI002ED83903